MPGRNKMVDVVELMKKGQKLSIGMVHTQPLPGSFRNKLDIEQIVKLAVEDAINLEKARFDAIIVENVNDGPYGTDGLPIQKVAALARICTEVRKAVKIPVGIDACGNQLLAFDIASMCGVSFMRLSNLVDVRVGNRGIVNPCGGEAVLRRKALNAENVKIFADIQVKHTYPMFPEISLETSARWAVGAGADVIIVTGAETGVETSLADIERVVKAVRVPVVAGSGVTRENVREQYSACDGAIIGSCLKKDKNLLNPIDFDLAVEFIKTAKGGK